MSSLLNPLHPGTLFIQKRLGQQFVTTAQIVMPPASTLVYTVSPPLGRIWILAVRAQGIPRDFVTNNPVIAAGLYTYARHSMVVSSVQSLGLESNFMFPWGIEIDLRVNDPLAVTVVNSTALTIIFDATLAIMEITEDKYDQYTRLWNGLYNFEALLGNLSDGDVVNLAALLRRISGPVVALEAIPAEEETSPTMAEDVNGIRRIKIP